MSFVVDPRFTKLDAVITLAKAEVGNFQATKIPATPADMHQVQALQQITEALTLMEALLKDIRDKKV